MEFIKFWFPIIKVVDLFLHPYLLNPFMIYHRNVFKKVCRMQWLNMERIFSLSILYKIDIIWDIYFQIVPL